MYFFQQQTQHYSRTPQLNLLIHFDHFFCFGLFSVKPEGRPTVSGFKTRHRVGDTLQMTCFINNTFPEANLTWFVSGKIVSTCVNKTLRAKLVEKLVDFRPRQKFCHFRSYRTLYEGEFIPGCSSHNKF